MRNLVLVLGDQLTTDSAALQDFDPAADAVVMIEAPGEANHVWSHKARIALFLSAMRHFAADVEARGWPLVYVRIDADAPPAFADRLRGLLESTQPQRLIVCEPGEYRILAAITDVCGQRGVALEVRRDRHFLCSRDAFAAWAGNKRELRMEYFYRMMRRETGVLMDGDGPAGGAWNFDRDNRAPFGRAGPGRVPAPPHFAPDAITQATIAEVEARFPDHPGSLIDFGWPVTRAQARKALTAFVRDRLGDFGRYQDAMWSDQPFLWHALLAAALNLKLLDPREVIAAAEAAWRDNDLPLPSVEGFIRQILGWREFIRGVYWLDMPGLADANHFGHERALPKWYWTGDTHMRCMQQAIGQTLAYGYAHHIQRLMLTGNFALLASVAPRQVCDWYLAVYVDAVEWVELPNTAGMALFANGGRFTSKPYVASGAYVNRMSNYCSGCRYRPRERTGERACPFTVLYWRFLSQHESSLAANPRTALMVRNWRRLSAADRATARREGDRVLARLDEL
jgi:deoxyribodipyrimidine photolyase-related protein